MGLINDNRWVQFAETDVYHGYSIMFADGCAQISPQASTTNVRNGQSGTFTAFDVVSVTPTTGSSSAYALLFHFPSHVSFAARNSRNDLILPQFVTSAYGWQFNNRYQTTIRGITEDFTWSTVTWATRPSTVDLGTHNPRLLGYGTSNSIYLSAWGNGSKISVFGLGGMANNTLFGCMVLVAVNAIDGGFYAHKMTWDSTTPDCMNNGVYVYLENLK